jgi:hypothetical protein
MSISPMAWHDIPDVVHELYPPDPNAPVVTPRSQAHRACLLSWAAVNGLPVDDMLLRRITVNVSARTVEYWVHGDAGPTPARPRILQSSSTGGRLERLPLVAEPAGILIGDDRCGHMTTVRDGEILACGEEVDAAGRHPGVHTGGTGGDIWLNEHPGVLPYRNGIPDVADRPSTEQHVLVLTALEERTDLLAGVLSGTFHERDLQGLAGRRRILERHAPAHTRVTPDGQRGTTSCRNGRCYATGELWPCPDYHDAAAGLVTGLETIR